MAEYNCSTGNIPSVNVSSALKLIEDTFQARIGICKCW